MSPGFYRKQTLLTDSIRPCFRYPLVFGGNESVHVSVIDLGRRTGVRVDGLSDRHFPAPFKQSFLTIALMGTTLYVSVDMSGQTFRGWTGQRVFGYWYSCGRISAKDGSILCGYLYPPKTDMEIGWILNI